MIGKPGTFYAHYSSAYSAFRYIVPSGKLRLFPYAEMRDPLEAREWGLHVVSILDEPPESTPGDRALATEAVRLAAQRLKKRVKLLCLTVDADLPFEQVGAFARAYAKPRMWEQYADNHAGVCLLMTKAPMDDAMKETLRGRPVGMTAHVTYTHTGLHDPRGPSALKGWDRSADQDQAVESHVSANWEHYFFTKAADWASEQEHRLALLGEVGTDELVDCGRAIYAVVLGHNFPAWQVRSAAAVCEQANVSLWQMSWDGGYPTTTHLGGGSRAVVKLELDTS